MECLFTIYPSPCSSRWVVSAHFLQKLPSEPSSILAHLSTSVCQGVDFLIVRLYLRVFLAEDFTTAFHEESFAEVLLVLK